MRPFTRLKKGPQTVKKRISNKGYALVSVMALGVVTLTITSAILLRMSSSAKQISLREQTDEALNISESVANQVMDAMAEFSSKASVDGVSNGFGVYFTANELAKRMLTEDDGFDGTDFLNSTLSGNSDIQYTRDPDTSSAKHTYPSFSSAGNGGNFFGSVEKNFEHSQKFWDTFTESSTAEGQTIDLGSNGPSYSTSNPFSFQSLHTAAFTTYKVTNKAKNISGEVQISLVPVGTDIEGIADEEMHNSATFEDHDDIFKLKVTTYIPTKASPRVSKTVDVIIKRPAERKNNDIPFPESAVLSEGIMDLGNVDTTAGPCAGVLGTCIDSTQKGDVHSNTSVTIGSNGSIQGKVTAVNTATVKTTQLPTTVYSSAEPTNRDSADVTTRVSNSHDSRSGADRIEVPQMDTDTSDVDDTECVDLDPDPDVIRYKDCKLTGGYNKNNNQDPKLELEGKVHIAGDFNNKGSVRCVGDDEPCRIVIDGVADTGGNGSSNYYSEQPSIYMVRGVDSSGNQLTGSNLNCLDIGGTPDATGENGTLFFVENPNCGSKFHGNFEFFGAVFTNGTFTGVGNASSAGIHRDSDMTTLHKFQKKVPKDKDELFPKMVSWKKVRD